MVNRDPIYDFSWLQSKTGTEAMTVSTDGQVLWWDTRRLGQPLEDLTLREKAPAAGANGGKYMACSNGDQHAHSSTWHSLHKARSRVAPVAASMRALQLHEAGILIPRLREWFL